MPTTRKEDIMDANGLHGKLLKGLQKLAKPVMTKQDRETLTDILINLDGLITAARAYLARMHQYKCKCDILAAICEDYTKDKK